MQNASHFDYVVNKLPSILLESSSATNKEGFPWSILKSSRSRIDGLQSEMSNSQYGIGHKWAHYIWNS